MDNLEIVDMGMEVGEMAESVRCRFQKADVSKILTGRSVEATMADGSSSFVELYGWSRSMKVLAQLVPGLEERGGVWLSDEGTYHYSERTGECINYRSLDDMCVENASLRRAVREELGTLDEDQVDVEVVRRMMNKYWPEVDLSGVAEVLKGVKADRVLNIGDPWRKISQEIDEPRLTNADYETGEEAGAGKTRVVTDVTREVKDRLGYDARENSYNGALTDMDRQWGDIPPGEDWDIDWLWGNPQEEGVEEGLTQLVYQAQKKTEALEVEATEETNAQAREAWQRVRDKLKQRRDYYMENEGRDVTKIDYDTSFGLHPLDIVSKSAALTAREAQASLEVLDYYQREVYPDLIHEYLEDLADIHAGAFRGELPVDEREFRIYKKVWNEFLDSRGFDPDNYQFHDPDCRFVDMLTEFFQLRGLRMVELLSPDFFNKIDLIEQDMINAQFPARFSEKEATFVKAMFPFTQELPSEGHDRITASWSFSTYMMPEMTRMDLVERVWPELNRLLAKGGRANIFPIGFRGLDAGFIMETITEYLAKSGSRWRVDMSRRVASGNMATADYDDYRMLVIVKE